MCGIVGAVSNRNIVPVLVQGLQRLEYRGYDSCGVAVHADGGLKRARSTSRVSELAEQVAQSHFEGHIGIAHTRWATHGAPAVHNAHPHFSHGPGADAQTQPARVALVHNGIIENHDELRAALKAKGYVFSSQTDTEVISHLVDSLYEGDIFKAVKDAIAQLHGAYAIAVFHRDEPLRVIGARSGSPLILGVGNGGAETFLASDAMALAGVTDQIVYLEEGDVVDLQLGSDRKASIQLTGAVRHLTPTENGCVRAGVEFIGIGTLEHAGNVQHFLGNVDLVHAGSPDPYRTPAESAMVSSQRACEGVRGPAGRAPIATVRAPPPSNAYTGDTWPVAHRLESTTGFPSATQRPMAGTAPGGTLPLPNASITTPS